MDSQSSDGQGQNSSSATNGSVSRPRRVRGPTTLLKLMAKQNGIQKEQLEWDDKGRPIGQNQVTYSDCIGVLLTLDHRFDWTKYWADINEEHKDWLWTNLTIFRSKKSVWKRRHYTPYDTSEERLEHRPSVLSIDEWSKLVRFWGTEEHTRISARNKVNRSKQIVKHTAGRKSFPRCKADMAKRNGTPLTRGDFFVETHINKETNDAIDQDSRDYIAKMRQQTGFDENGSPLPIPDQVYRNVMPKERRRRVRGEGLGVTSPTSQTSSSTTNVARITDLEQQVSDLKRKLEEKDEEMKKRIKERDDEYERRMKEREEETERQNIEREKRLMEKLEEMIGMRLQPRI